MKMTCNSKTIYSCLMKYNAVLAIRMILINDLLLSDLPFTKVYNL